MDSFIIQKLRYSILLQERGTVAGRPPKHIANAATSLATLSDELERRLRYSVKDTKKKLEILNKTLDDKFSEDKNDWSNLVKIDVGELSEKQFEKNLQLCINNEFYLTVDGILFFFLICTDLYFREKLSDLEPVSSKKRKQKEVSQPKVVIENDSMNFQEYMNEYTNSTKVYASRQVILFHILIL